MAQSPLDIVKNLFAHQKCCVLAVAHNPAPHCAVMVYLYDAGNNKIYLLTHRDTRKYYLVRTTGWASLFFDNRGEAEPASDGSISAIIMGTARIITGEGGEPLKKALVERAPVLTRLADDPRAAVIEISPVNCRLILGLRGVHDFSLET